MSELIVTTAGQPFKDEKAAQMRAGILEKREGKVTEVVAHEGGFALKVLKEAKRVRVPVGVRNRLTVANKDPNFEYRVVNDYPESPGRIQQFEDGGWELSNNDVGDPKAGKAASVGGHTAIPVGGGVTGRVMRIKKEWYEQDKKAKEDRLRAVEDGILRREKADGLIPHDQL